MSTHTKLAELLNTGRKFTHDGKEYTLKTATIKQRAEFATWLENRAWETIERRQLNGASDQTVKEQRSELVNAIAAGKYEWGGEVAVASVQSVVGAAQLMFIVLKDEHSEITEEIVLAMMEAKHREIQAFAAEHLTDPKVLSELVGFAAGKPRSRGSATAKNRSSSKKSKTSHRRK